MKPALAEALASAEYLSWPTPAARPKTRRFLLAVRRQALVFVWKPLTLYCTPLLPGALRFTDGRSRRMYEKPRPGTRSDSWSSPTRAPKPSFRPPLGVVTLT